MLGAKYCDYIGMEIRDGLRRCIEKPRFKEGYYTHPMTPLISKVTRVSSAETNAAVGPMTKTIYVEDTFGARYKVSVEDLKEVKGHGWITKAEADKLGWFEAGVHWDRDEQIYKVNDAEYVSWLKAEREKVWGKKPKGFWAGQ